METEKNKLEIVIQVKDLRKRYREGSLDVHAADGLNINVRQGEILGILGPNGAGKTTFLNILTTLLLADSGTVTILGIPSIPRHFSRIRRLINMSSGYPNYPWVMTVEENLRFYGRLYGLKGQQLQNKIAELLELFELTEYAKRRFDQLSSGIKQRLSLAKALINDPKIIFLDEPTIGLDPDVALKLRSIILNVLKARKMTVLLTSHNMDEVQAMCDRVAFIKKGQIVKLATVDELKRLHNTDDLEDVFIQIAHSKEVAIAHQEQDDTVRMVQAPQESQQGLGVSGWFGRLWAFTIRNAIFARRNLFVMTDVFFWPLISLLSIGLMTKFINVGSATSSFIITGAIAAGILQIVQLDVGYTVLYELWSKSFKHTLLTPLGVSEGIWGCWLTGVLRGLCVFGFLSIAAHQWFDFVLPDTATTVIFIVGLNLCAILLGMMVNMLILSFGQKVEITAWMFAHLFMIVCGIYYPIDVLPGWAKGIASAIPITYFLEFIRQAYGFQAQHTHVLLKGFALSALYYVLGVWFLKRAYLRARRKGVIVRMSE